jgi:iron complex outermembrane receptor protein
VDWTVTAGARYDFGAGWFARVAGGRKTRFPTMRELFGEALNRFLVNPDLEPESSVLLEAGFGVRGGRVSGEIVPFATLTANTIDQQSVTLEGETQPRRQRINLRGSRVVGVELVGTARPLDRVAVDAQLTFLHPRARQRAPGDPEYLSEKPEVIGRASVRYVVPSGLDLAVECVYTGRAYSLTESNDFAPLPTSMVMNLRVAQDIPLTTRSTVEIFGRVDNVTDAAVVPQLGLPGPGRSFSAGVEVGL